MALTVATADDVSNEATTSAWALFGRGAMSDEVSNETTMSTAWHFSDIMRFPT